MTVYYITTALAGDCALFTTALTGDSALFTTALTGDSALFTTALTGDSALFTTALTSNSLLHVEGSEVRGQCKVVRVNLLHLSYQFVLIRLRQLLHARLAHHVAKI